MYRTVSQEIGGPKFDANVVSRFQVNETTGNLYVYHHLMTLPSHRGSPLNLYFTYNSGNKEQGLFSGKKWSFSLAKYIETGEFYLVDDLGSWPALADLPEEYGGEIEIEVSEGDLLAEEPDEADWGAMCGDLEGLESDLLQEKQDLEDELGYIGEAESQIPLVESELSELFNLYEDLGDAWFDYNEAMGYLIPLWGQYDDWEDLREEPHWRCYIVGPYCGTGWMEDGAYYYLQELGGCSAFIYAGAIEYWEEEASQAWDEILRLWGDPEDNEEEPDPGSVIGEQIDKLNGELEVLNGYISNIDVDWDWDGDLEELGGALDELKVELSAREGRINGRLDDIDDELKLIQSAIDVYCNFEDLAYTPLPGMTFHDGEGEGFFILEGHYDAHSNPLHVAVDLDDPEGSTITYKDGRVYRFEPEGRIRRILSMEDRYGNTVSFSYFTDNGTAFTMVTDTVGRTITFSDESVVVSHEGQERAWSVDRSGLTTTITNPEGEETEFVYHAEIMGFLAKITDPGGCETHFEYNQAESRCSRVRKIAGNDTILDTHYEYTLGPHGVASAKITDSRGNVHTKQIIGLKMYEIESLRRHFVSEIEDPYGSFTRYTYAEDFFHLVKTTDTNNVAHEMVYDEMGNLLQKSSGIWSMTYTYEDVYNQVTSVTDANNHTKYFHYVADGLPEDHGPDGVKYMETDARNNETRHWYNEFGQRIKTEDALGSITEFSYYATTGLLSSVRKYCRDAPQGYYEKTFSYDAFGNKTSETDFNGNETTYQYDEMNRMTWKTVHEHDDILLNTQYHYDDAGNLERMVNPRGMETEYAYDGFNRLIGVTEAVGTDDARTRGYKYDTENNKVEETDHRQNATTFDYDDLNRLIEKIEPLGKRTKYVFGGAGDSSTDGGSPRYNRSNDRYTEMRQFNNNEWVVTKYEYDELYRLKEETKAHGTGDESPTIYGYDAVGNKTSETDARNNTHHFDYDEDNRLTETTDPHGKSVIYRYDEVGNKIEEEDKNENVTKYEYDELNRVIEIIEAFGTDDQRSLEYSYDGENKVAEKDPNGPYWTNFSYNARNLLIRTAHAIPGAVYQYTYDEVGNKTLEIDPNLNPTQYSYDWLNRLVETEDALGNTTTYEYDRNDNRTRIIDAKENETVFVYDALNRLREVHDLENGLTKYEYDLMGNKTLIEDPRHKQTSHYYDRLNRLILTLNANQQATQYKYDKVGNRTERKDAENQIIIYDYDNLNRLTHRQFGAGSFVEYTYDAAGNRKGMTDSTGTTAYDYDDLNRLISETVPLPGGGNSTISYTYYPGGQRETMAGPTGTTTYEYDAMNRLVEIADPENGVTGYSYDLASRLTGMVYPSGAIATYAYDDANRLVHLKSTDSTGNATFTEFTYKYDDVGNRVEVIEPEGTTYFEYDNLYRLTRAVYPDSGAVTYYYDAAGNRRRERWDDGAERNYTYNNLNQLTSWTVATEVPFRDITVTGTVSGHGILGVTVNDVEASLNQQTFTAEGVRLTLGSNLIAASAIDAAGSIGSHQIEVFYEPAVSEVRAIFSYDKNGCLIKKTVKTPGQLDDEVTEYQWDYEHRLVGVTLPNETTNEFIYDGDKRRVGAVNAAQETRWFRHDGLNVVAEFGSQTQASATYLHGIGIDKLISRTTSEGRLYYHTDAIGSVRSLTDQWENQTAAYSYDAWGRVLTSSGNDGGSPYKFTSREWEDEIGLQFNRARFYDPDLGRFISPDPLTGGPDDPTISYFSGVYSQIHRFIREYVDSLQPHKLNRYVYCYNNPVNNIDPLGLEPPIKQVLIGLNYEINARLSNQREIISAFDLGDSGRDIIGINAIRGPGYDVERARSFLLEVGDEMANQTTIGGMKKFVWDTAAVCVGGGLVSKGVDILMSDRPGMETLSTGLSLVAGRAAGELLESTILGELAEIGTKSIVDKTIEIVATTGWDQGDRKQWLSSDIHQFSAGIKLIKDGDGTRVEAIFTKQTEDYTEFITVGYPVFTEGERGRTLDGWKKTGAEVTVTYSRVTNE